MGCKLCGLNHTSRSAMTGTPHIGEVAQVMRWLKENKGYAWVERGGESYYHRPGDAPNYFYTVPCLGDYWFQDLTLERVPLELLEYQNASELYKDGLAARLALEI